MFKERNDRVEVVRTLDSGLWTQDSPSTKARKEQRKDPCFQSGGGAAGVLAALGMVGERCSCLPPPVIG